LNSINGSGRPALGPDERATLVWCLRKISGEGAGEGTPVVATTGLLRAERDRAALAGSGRQERSEASRRGWPGTRRGCRLGRPAEARRRGVAGTGTAAGGAPCRGRMAPPLLRSSGLEGAGELPAARRPAAGAVSELWRTCGERGTAGRSPSTA